MNKKRLQKLAGVLNEQADPNQEFVGRLEGFTREKIYNQLNEHLQDEISDGNLPEGTRLELDDITDEVAQKYANDFVEVLYDTAGESMVEAHMDLIHKTLKKIKVIRRRAVGMKRQQQRD